MDMKLHRMSGTDFLFFRIYILLLLSGGGGPIGPNVMLYVS